MVLPQQFTSEDLIVCSSQISNPRVNTARFCQCTLPFLCILLCRPAGDSVCSEGLHPVLVLHAERGRVLPAGDQTDGAERSGAVLHAVLLRFSALIFSLRLQEFLSRIMFSASLNLRVLRRLREVGDVGSCLTKPCTDKSENKRVRMSLIRFLNLIFGTSVSISIYRVY